MGIIESGKSSIDNLREVDWVLVQTKRELEAFKEENFYEKNSDGTVNYKEDLVKRYLESIK